MDENKEMTIEEVKEEVNNNFLLQQVLKIMNDIPLIERDENGNEIETEYDYGKLYENVSMLKKTNSIEYKPDSAQFYYQLMSLGYDNFGEEFFRKLLQTNPEYLVTSIILFLEQLNQCTQYIQTLEMQLTAEIENNKCECDCAECDCKE